MPATGAYCFSRGLLAFGEQRNAARMPPTLFIAQTEAAVFPAAPGPNLQKVHHKASDIPVARQ